MRGSTKKQLVSMGFTGEQYSAIEDFRRKFRGLSRGGANTTLTYQQSAKLFTKYGSNVEKAWRDYDQTLITIHTLEGLRVTRDELVRLMLSPHYNPGESSQIFIDLRNQQAKTSSQY